MLLEKLNEVVWNVRRKNRPGVFEFRATEQGGKIKKISISLIDEENNKQSIRFEMDKNEFNTFFDIISKFKKILESPSTINSAVLSESEPEEDIIDDQITPLRLDGEVDEAGQEAAINETLNAIDASLASLENLDREENEAGNSSSGGPRLSPPVVSPEPLDQAIGSARQEKKRKLDPTEWDPW